MQYYENVTYRLLLYTYHFMLTVVVNNLLIRDITTLNLFFILAVYNILR